MNTANFRGYTFRPLAMLVEREVKRFYRQRSRVIGALLAPLFIWLLLGFGLGNTFQSPFVKGEGYLEYFYPGILVLVLLFTSIFSAISVIEDRHEGFLQGVLVAPVTRLGIVGGKVLGGAILSFLQALLFLSVTLLFMSRGKVVSYSLLFAAMGLMSVTFSSIGFWFAWKLDSVQGFHSIMNTVLMPMWLLSGAPFPVETAPVWLRYITYANPVTYGMWLIRYALYPGKDFPRAPSLLVCLSILGACTAIFIGLTILKVQLKSEETS